MALERKNPSVTHHIVYQLAWCTAERRPLLDAKVQRRLTEVIKLIVCPEHGWLVGRLRPSTDHVYLRVRVRPTDAPAHVAARMMDRTQQVLRAEFPALHKLPKIWAGPYYVVTAGRMDKSMLQQYVAGQPRARRGLFG